jgi:CRP-like cAMP-binding protein
MRDALQLGGHSVGSRPPSPKTHVASGHPYNPPGRLSHRQSMATHAGPSERVAMLGAVPLLSGLTQSQLERLAATGDDRSFRAGQPIVREGEKGLELYLLLSGTVDVRRSGRTVTSLSAGQFFGEAALLVDEPRTADVLATSDVRCFVLNRWDFWGAMGIDPQGDRALFEETVQRLRSFRTELVE